MIATKSKKKTVKPVTTTKTPSKQAAGGDVMNLAETARYLRVSEDEVTRLVTEQNLPGRLLGSEWRFLKTAIQDWLKTPPPAGTNEGIWALAGA